MHRRTLLAGIASLAIPATAGCAGIVGSSGEGSSIAFPAVPNGTKEVPRTNGVEARTTLPESRQSIDVGTDESGDSEAPPAIFLWSADQEREVGVRIVDVDGEATIEHEQRYEVGPEDSVALTVVRKSSYVVQIAGPDTQESFAIPTGYYDCNTRKIRTEVGAERIAVNVHSTMLEC